MYWSLGTSYMLSFIYQRSVISKLCLGEKIQLQQLSSFFIKKKTIVFLLRQKSETLELILLQLQNRDKTPFEQRIAMYNHEAERWEF